MTILEVYEKYKPFDNWLSDKEWLPKMFLSTILYELWQAVKEECERKCDES